jgi:hypothetical protein
LIRPGWSRPDISCFEVPLIARDARGLRWFFLLGWLDQSPAAAEWDGRRLRISQPLFDMASLAIRIDGVFADCGPSEPSHVASLTDSPARALITLADACEGIYVLETIDENGRCSW